MYRLYFTAQAQHELHETKAFYQQIAPTIARHFVQEVERMSEEVEQRPTRFPEAEEGIRKAVFTGKYPYYFLFYIAGAEVWVLTLSHQRRHPEAWKH
jgi:hypothetical protein